MENNSLLNNIDGGSNYFQELEKMLLNRLEREKRLDRLKNKELPQVNTPPFSEKNQENTIEGNALSLEKIKIEYNELKKIVSETPELSSLQNRLSAMSAQSLEPIQLISLYRIISRALKDSSQKSQKNSGCSQSDLKKLETTIAELEKQLAEKERELFVAKESVSLKERKLQDFLEQYEKLEFDFNKFRERSIQESESKNLKAVEDLILKILPAIDNLERACATASSLGSENPLYQGFIKVEEYFSNVLTQYGIEVIQQTGAPFDPNIHEAFIVEETDEFPDDTVIEVILKGYQLNSKLLRPASVKVSKQNTATINQTKGIEER